MKDQNFNNLIKSIYNHEEEAPDVMSGVYNKRNGWYIFRNRLYIQRYRLLGAAALLALIATVIFMYLPPTSQETDNIANSPSALKNEEIKTGNNEELSNFPSEVQTEIESESVTPSTATETRGNAGFNENEQPIENGHTGEVTLPTSRDDHPEEPQFVEVVDQPTRSDMNEDNNVPEPDAKVVPTTSESNEVGGETETDKAVGSEDKLVVAKDEPFTDSDEVVSGAEKPNEIDQEVTTPDHPPIKKLSLSIGYGPAYAYRNLSAPVTSDMSQANELLRRRNKAEKPLFSHQAFMVVNYEVTTNLEIYSGLNFLSRREQMTYTKSETQHESKVTSRIVEVIHPLLPPLRYTLYDTTYTDITITETVDQKNSYRYLTVPVGLRYTLYKNRTGFYLSVDGAFHIASANTGSVLALGKVEQDLNSAGFKRSNFGASVGAAAGVSYLFDPRFTGLAELRGTRFQTPTNSSRYSIDQYDRSYSLLLGVKYNF